MAGALRETEAPVFRRPHSGASAAQSAPATHRRSSATIATTTRPPVGRIVIRPPTRKIIFDRAFSFSTLNPGPSTLDPPSSHTADVAVVGSGFGGCLTALILQRIGRRVVVIDNAVHPRFAIGESSTPIADVVLHDLATRYDLPRLKPLCRFGAWCQAYPGVARGLKRGFSYFRHEAGAPFRPDAEHRNELLVTASASDAVSDTHWFRADVDAFLAGEVCAAGIPLLEGVELTEIVTDGPGWVLRGLVPNAGDGVQLRARFVVDASGAAGVIPRALGVESSAAGVSTDSRALFSHFRNVGLWEARYRQSGGDTGDHPFACDAAAVHHVFDDGWMWQLRFDNGVTSAGFVFDARKHPLDESISPEDEWLRQWERLPSLAAQFANAEIVDPPGRLIRTSRLQRRAKRIVGENWALLPHTAGFIDPLHSTGIAHTLCGVERLTEILNRAWDRDALSSQLREYERTLFAELDLIDGLVAGCYASLGDHRLFAAFCMLYFAAATTCEQRRTQSGNADSSGYLLGDEAGFCAIVDRLGNDVRELAGRPASELEIAAFESRLAEAITPYNTVGLCDATAHNMYRHTAAVKGPG
ncbi:MAG: NAD(P)/FAD-dependent oxidoreductase [Planctomycetaceae bacterium]